MAKVSSFTKDASLNRFLKRFPEEVANSFTGDQLQAMRAALQTTQWRRHPVDIRLTLPLLWKKFYVVLVAGPEQRSQQRRTQDRDKNPVWTLPNLLFIALLMGLGILLSVGIFQLKSISLDFLTETDLHPAGIPFKPDQQSCEESGRIWQDNECIDFAHDPLF